MQLSETGTGKAGQTPVNEENSSTTSFTSLNGLRTGHTTNQLGVETISRGRRGSVGPRSNLGIGLIPLSQEPTTQNVNRSSIPPSNRQALSQSPEALRQIRQGSPQTPPSQPTFSPLQPWTTPPSDRRNSFQASNLQGSPQTPPSQPTFSPLQPWTTPPSDRRNSFQASNLQGFPQTPPSQPTFSPSQPWTTPPSGRRHSVPASSLQGSPQTPSSHSFAFSPVQTRFTPPSDRRNSLPASNLQASSQMAASLPPSSVAQQQTTPSPERRESLRGSRRNSLEDRPVVSLGMPVEPSGSAGPSLNGEARDRRQREDQPVRGLRGH